MSPPNGFRPPDFAPPDFAPEFAGAPRETRAQATAAAPGRPADTAAPDEPAPRPGGPWPELCDQFGLQLLVLAEQLRTSLDELEADEADPERLQRLYQVDHAVTRMRRACRDLRTLAGRAEEELAGFTTSLLDVIRMALSGIERYTQVSVGRVTDLAVLGYAADDIGELMAALLDNATRYSPGAVTVSAHLLDDGSVLFRIEDNGIGIAADQAAALNEALAGPVPEVDERTGRHTGFPVVHRVAHKHTVGVRLTARPHPASGTIALVTIPPHLLCEVPAEQTQRRPAAVPLPSAIRPTTVNDVSQLAPARPHQPRRPEPPDGDGPGREQHPGLAVVGSRPAAPGRPASGGAADSAAPLPGTWPPGNDGLASGLPRRSRAGRGADEPRTRPRDQARPASERQQAAARRAFADDLSAFSQGAGSLSAARDRGGADDDIALEEESTP
jgi:Histidine kinase-, DNA gyrase B-, and HSP90-like ATPase